MVAGLKFLSKKGFNPQNMTNQKRVWEREQEKKEATKKASERDRLLKRERDDEELALARGDLPKLSFMYAVPPGLDDKKKESEVNDSDKKPAAAAVANSLGERQPGDDDAAAAFRLMLASSGGQNQKKTAASTGESGAVVGNVILQGTTFDAMTEKKPKGPLSELEKAVGRRNDNKNLSLDEQIQRFPALANAPRAKGMTATDIGVSFKPLGAQIRNVRCLACGIWGHSKGDRECKQSGWDPFSAKLPPQELPASSITLRDDEMRHSEKQRRRRRSDDDSSASSSSDDSSSYERRRRKKKHRKKHRSREGSSSKRRSKEGEPDDRKRRHKSSHKKSKRR